MVPRLAATVHNEIVDPLWQDLKYAARGFARQPGFTATAVIALALAIGANTAIFSAVNAVLLHPLAFQSLKNPDRLAMLWEKNPSLALIFANNMPARMTNFREWKQQSHSFEDLAAWRDTTLTLTSENDRAGLKPEDVEAGIATSNFFPLLGIRPRLGRNFTPEEMEGGKGQVAILSDELHKSRFNGDLHILGKTLMANRQEYEIVGVLPPAFQLPAVWEGFDQRKPKIWLPLNLHPSKQEGETFGLYVFGRLKPGVSLAQARAEMNIIGERLAKTNPDDAGFGINVASLSEEDVGPDLRRALAVLLAAVAFVLLIACANVGNLLLTRAVGRDKEIAVRAAIGASRSRIVRQAVTESVLLSLIAAAAGLLLSFWALRVLSSLAPTDTHGLHELRIDRTVLVFTSTIAVLAGLLFGLAPAFHALKENVNEVLNRTGRSLSGSSHRLRNSLAIIEIALSFVLLIGAGLMIRSLETLMSTDLGFKIDHLLIMRISLPDAKYVKPEQVAQFNDQLIESVRKVLGIQAASLTTALPMKSVSEASFEIPGKTFKPGTLPVSDWARISDGYFETLRMKLVKGRTFSRQEASSDKPDVVIVNQAFTRAYFPREDPIGKIIVFGDENERNTNYRIIGTVADEHQMGPDNQQHAEFYLPSHRLRSMILVARTAGDPLAMAGAVKQQVWSIDKEQPVSEVGTEEEALREWSAPRRFNATILLNFAGIALVLASLGLYSVLAYSVTLRTREIGIRMALGAAPGSVTALVLRQGAGMALVGITIGICAALGVTRFMQSLIFGVSAVDVTTFVAVSLLLLAISAAASYLPAVRAAKVDPIEALRAE